MEEIKAGDIMIGNYFMFENTTHIVTEISETLVATRWIKGNDKYIHELSDLRPIPLTEDILLGAGFEKDEEGLFSSYPTIVTKTKTRWAFYNNGLSGGELVRIDYLHQLQNIYRLCMNQDLKINL